MIKDWNELMHRRTGLCERLYSLSHPDGPVFEPSDDPVLIAFAQIFRSSGLHAFDAHKHLRTDALSPIYDCETESCRDSVSLAERFFAIWAPVWRHTSPIHGFRTGQDSAWLGSTPTVAMPQDERTAALLLLVTSSYVHLSASTSDETYLVQGAVDLGGLNYRFVTLAPSSRHTLTEAQQEEQTGFWHRLGHDVHAQI